MLAGGIAAAIAQRALTGKASVVDVSLLNAGMWVMQPEIVASNLVGIDEMPKAVRLGLPNPLVNNYRTADGRYIALCMLQGQRYWPGLCRALERHELIKDPRFASDANRFIQNVDYGDGRSIKMVSTPVQFDRHALDARPASELGAHNTEVLTALGYDEDAIIGLKMSGAIF